MNALLAGMWLLLAAAMLVASASPEVPFALQMLSLAIGVACASGGFSLVGQALHEWLANRQTDGGDGS